MSARKRDRERRRAGIALRGATALGIALGITGLPEAGAIAAQQVALKLTYTCTFPYVGDESASVKIDSDIPNSIAVGQSTAHYLVKASVAAPWELTVSLRALGVSTITGTIDGQARVTAPQGDLTVTVPFDIPKITLPAVSSFNAGAAGSAPEVTFTKPGKAEITVGNFILHLVPRDSNGNLTSLGEPDVPCTLNARQNDVAASFTITAAANPALSNSKAEPTDPGSPRSSVSTSTSVQASTASPSESVTRSPTVSPTDPGPTGGGDTASVTRLGVLAALALGFSAAAFRYGPRLWNRRRTGDDA